MVEAKTGPRARGRTPGGERRRRRLAVTRDDGGAVRSLYTPDDLRPLGLELSRVSLVRFFLALHLPSRVSTGEPEGGHEPPHSSSRRPESPRYSASPTSHHSVAQSSLSPDSEGVGLMLTSSNPLHL